MLLHTVQTFGVFDAAIILAECVIIIFEMWKKCGDQHINKRIMQVD